MSMRVTKYVLKFGTNGRKFPLMGFITLWLLMDRFTAPQWLHGIYWFVVGLLIVCDIIDRVSYKEQEVDIQKFLKNYYEAKEQDKKVKS